MNIINKIYKAKGTLLEMLDLEELQHKQIFKFLN